MKEIIVDLHITADEYLKHYQGSAKMVAAYSRDGRRVQFPTGILQRFVTREGIIGSFAIYYDDNNKFQSVVKL